jgi:hypothetical protein
MMISKIFFPAALVTIAIGFSGCRGMDCVYGSGNQVTENRNVESFSAIEVGGSVKLILKQDSTTSVRIVADDNIQDRIETRVSGGRLHIEMDGNFCETGPITIYATTRTLEGVDASGSVEVISDGTLSGERFALDLSGSTKVNLLLNTGEMRTDASGATEVTLKGQARSHEISMSGSGDVQALDFVVGNYRISTSGSTDLKINALNELHVESSGASDISYRGNPKNVKNSNSGASSLNKIQ